MRQYLSTSWMRGSTESTALSVPFWARALRTVRISEKPNAPTSVGISDSPPPRSGMPNVKRS